MTDRQVVTGTTVCQFNADGTVVGETHNSLAALRWAIGTGTLARVSWVKRLVLTTPVDVRAVVPAYLGYCVHANGAVSECNGATLVILVSLSGDLVTAANELTQAYNSVFGQPYARTE